MSEYRQLHRGFWESQSVEELDPIEKLAYLYLITGPQSNMEGVYKLSLRRMALETGIDKEMCIRICARLEEVNLAGWYDGWACVTQAINHMPQGQKMLTHAENLYSEIPNEIHQWLRRIRYRYPIALDKTILDNTRQEAPLSKSSKQKPEKPRHPTLDVPMNQTRYDTLCREYGQSVVDGTMESVKDWAASKGKRILDYAASAANWMKRDGVAKRATTRAGPRAPTVCPECGGVVRSTHREALCGECYTKWELIDGEWRRVK